TDADTQHDYDRSDRRECRSANPSQPAGRRLGLFLAEACLKPSIEIGRRLRRLPFVKQAHCLLYTLELFGAGPANAKMSRTLAGNRDESQGQIRHQFLNFLA